MLLDDDNPLPFHDYELAVDVHLDESTSQTTKYKKKKRKTRQRFEQPSVAIVSAKASNLPKTFYIYFENSQDENNFLSFVTYTGPINTLHLGQQIYLPQLTLPMANNSTVSFQRFVDEYNQASLSVIASADTSISVFLRFGIMYLIQSGTIPPQTLALTDFFNLKNRGKNIKTSFYTSKGVSSPKDLLTAITKHGFYRSSVNAYSYDIQLFTIKKNQRIIFHFLYDEQLHCRDILCRAVSPLNFDFIRDKSSSIFRSIDDSYSDIFDFRIQLQQTQFLSKDDPNVLAVLREVPIDQVLYVDTTDCILHVSPKLRKFVKYMKCTRSSKYTSPDNQTTIAIGAYEEFRLNAQGMCELSMKSENTMTIELLGLKALPPAEKLYNLGMWFSSLCQTCFDLPSTTVQQTSNNRHRWFSNIPGLWQRNRTVKQINVDQLTRYTTQKSNQTYTTEELAFVKRILREENLRQVLPNVNDEKWKDQRELNREFEKIKKRLESSGAPSANEALKKIERAYHMLSEDFALNCDEQNKV